MQKKKKKFSVYACIFFASREKRIYMLSVKKKVENYP